MTAAPTDSQPWHGRAAAEFTIKKEDVMALHSTLSRLEARCLLEAALESRNPRLLARKPTGGGLPIDLYALHQTVLRFGGYRKVSHRLTIISSTTYLACPLLELPRAAVKTQ
jgi:hypothetical protein